MASKTVSWFVGAWVRFYPVPHPPSPYSPPYLPLDSFKKKPKIPE